MFSTFSAGLPSRQAKTLGVSLVLHGLLLAWLLYNPPRFLAPSSVAAGVPGGAITQLYWPAQPVATGRDAATPSAKVSAERSAARKRLEWEKSLKRKAPAGPSPAPSPDDAEDRANAATPSVPALPAGQLYGTSQGGATSGDEIRPALPLHATDPVVSGSDLAGRGEGSVVVEITIDDKGNIVQKVVLQSLGPAIDNKVLSALESWHFAPATRNGVAIPSKQDVYYHFKPGQS